MKLLLFPLDKQRKRVKQHSISEAQAVHGDPCYSLAVRRVLNYPRNGRRWYIMGKHAILVVSFDF
jgi:hypothetical protein